MPIGLSLVLVVFFLLMNAFFVMAEFALVRVRKSQIDILVEVGARGAKNAQKISRNVNAYLSACQLGITLASLALGWLGEPAVSALFHPLFEMMGLPAAVNHAIAVAIGFCIITALHIIVGELIPKSLAIFSTERYALRTSGLLVFFYRLTYPIMWLFNTITNGVVKLLGHDPSQEHDAYTGEEIQLLVDESAENGLIDSDQSEFVNNIFDIADKDIEAIMTPRTDMVCLDAEDTLENNLKLIDDHKFTRYPIFKTSKDDIIGFVHIKDIYHLGPHATMEDIRIRRIVAAPESMPAVKLLQMFKRERTKIALVIDEHGGTSGMVTMGDILEELVGEYDDEYVHGSSMPELAKLGEGHYLAAGSLPIDDFAEELGFDEDNFTEFETLAGLLLDQFDRIPKVGDETSYDEHDTSVRFVVRSMEAHRILQIEFWVTYAETHEE